jgi:hypothetical protein
MTVVLVAFGARQCAMSVYVDNMKAPYGRMIMCHMIADTRAELIAMADRIGVARKWLQKAGQPFEHFDICLSKRKKAIAFGAREISRVDLVALLNHRRDIAIASS